MKTKKIYSVQCVLLLLCVLFVGVVVFLVSQSRQMNRMGNILNSTIGMTQSVLENQTTVTKTQESIQNNIVNRTDNTQVINVPTTGEFKIVVNKKHPLSEHYDPGENTTAKNAFLKLKQDMQNLGYAVSDNYSGYRSYTYQQTLYNNYVSKDGKEEADKYSARAGYSEHQTGLVFDLIDTSGSLLGTGIQDGSDKWLSHNAHKYGFVVRYQKGKEHITGYIAESWHIRFVGNDAVTMYNNNLTLEEFYGVDGGDYSH